MFSLTLMIIEWRTRLILIKAILELVRQNLSDLKRFSGQLLVSTSQLSDALNEIRIELIVLKRGSSTASFGAFRLFLLFLALVGELLEGRLKFERQFVPTLLSGLS